MPNQPAQGTSAPTRSSPFIGYAVAGQAGLVWAFCTTPYIRENQSAAVMRALVSWMPGSHSRPLVAWGVLSAAIAVVLAVGWVKGSSGQRTRMLGWVAGAGLMGFISATYILAIYVQKPNLPPASHIVPVYTLTLMGAHISAVARETHFRFRRKRS